MTKTLKEQGVTTSAGLYWADEMRVGLIGQLRRLWAPRGYKLVQALEYTHQWAYLNLAVNGIEGRIYWNWTENMKAESIAPVIKDFSKQGICCIVWDRARGHRGACYEQVSIPLIEQPPYSPELNPAERIFEYLRDKIEGKVYGSIKAKMQAVENELRTLASLPERIMSLAGWHWITQAIDALNH